MILLFSLQAVASLAQELAKTLLWRIETEDHAPSYLYGTVHSKDERAFQFTDSVLPALRRCELVAGELDLDAQMSGTMDVMNVMLLPNGQRLEDLYARDLATAVGEVPRHCDHGTADVAEVPVWESARRVLERVEQQLARSRPNQRVSKLRDGLVLLADLLRERPGAHARFFDGRGMTMRLPEIAVLFEASDGGDDDLWLVPVRRI